MPTDQVTTNHECPKCGTPVCSRTVDEHVYPEFSPKQLAMLAEFVGELKGYNVRGEWTKVWHFPGMDISTGNWQPHVKPEHGWLILQALAENAGGWFYVLRLLSDRAFGNESRFDFWPAVCRAAFEVVGGGE